MHTLQYTSSDAGNVDYREPIVKMDAGWVNVGGLSDIDTWFMGPEGEPTECVEADCGARLWFVNDENVKLADGNVYILPGAIRVK